MCDECMAFLASDMTVSEFLRRGGTDGRQDDATGAALPAVETPGNDVNPACGCRLKSRCDGCSVCTNCDGCYCNED